jgi:hypothetical protein
MHSFRSVTSQATKWQGADLVKPSVAASCPEIYPLLPSNLAHCGLIPAASSKTSLPIVTGQASRSHYQRLLNLPLLVSRYHEGHFADVEFDRAWHGTEEAAGRSDTAGFYESNCKTVASSIPSHRTVILESSS